MSHPLEHYYYELKDENIRKEPLLVRHNSRLFVYDTKSDTVTMDYFYNVAKYLPIGSLMVRNVTGVVPARVTFTKDTGGKVNGLFLVNEGFSTDGTIPIIVDRKIEVGKTYHIEQYMFTVLRQDEQRFYVRPEFDKTLLLSVLEKYGTTPTPPYLGKQTLSEDILRQRYQTIFARRWGASTSIAAPTASLHFTEEVFHRIRQKNITTTDIILDVGLGTFGEVKVEHVKNKKLHKETITIPTDTRKKIKEYKQNKKQIIAVGTTVTRTLESKSKDILTGGREEIHDSTDLFIMPPFDFKIVDILITNFHVPHSSLMALVDAFLEYKGAKCRILELYALAQENDFKFYSFGDSMLIL
jgi:S-adenosylmethionine:tRNA ribosyltransferase-isomerase